MKSAKLFLIATLAAGLIGCAGSAPPLPTDTTGTNRQSTVQLSDFPAADVAMSCNSIASERAQNKAAIEKDNQAIMANRKSNEVAGAFGGFFTPAYLATEGNYAEKDHIQALSQRQDVLLKLAAIKNCRQQ